MDMQLQGKRAIVTGSTAGIGLAIATGLAREGAAVVVNGRTEARVRSAIIHIQEQIGGRGSISGIAADISTLEGFETLTKSYPETDILVNNLGMYQPRPFPEITDEEWNQFWNFNVMSGARLSRWYLPKMLIKNWGRVLFISSESGVNIPVEMIHYGVTKTAQIALARGIAETTVGTGVTVNSILPGPTRSEGVVDFMKNLATDTGKTETQIEEDFFKTVRPSSLIKRFAASEEVANLAVYLSSPLASATNGAAVRVDGGVVRSIL